MKPTHLRIGGQKWAIKYRSPSRMGGNSGLCTYSKAQLDVATQQTPFDTRDTLLHETFHAILAMQGRQSTDPEAEEVYVRALATGLIGVLQDNPEFSQWLTEPIK